MPELAVKAVMSRSFAYQVCSGERAPGRDVLLRMALAMKLSVDETQRLLCIARKGIISRSGLTFQNKIM